MCRLPTLLLALSIVLAPTFNDVIHFMDMSAFNYLLKISIFMKYKDSGIQKVKEEMLRELKQAPVKKE